MVPWEKSKCCQVARKVRTFWKVQKDFSGKRTPQDKEKRVLPQNTIYVLRVNGFELYWETGKASVLYTFLRVVTHNYLYNQHYPFHLVLLCKLKHQIFLLTPSCCYMVLSSSSLSLSLLCSCFFPLFSFFLLTNTCTGMHTLIPIAGTNKQI